MAFSNWLLILLLLWPFGRLAVPTVPAQLAALRDVPPAPEGHAATTKRR